MADLKRSVLSIALTTGIGAAAVAQDAVVPTVDEDGTIHGALSEAPMSSFLSPETKSALTERLRGAPLPNSGDTIEAARARSDATSKELLEAWLEVYPADIESATIGDAHVYMVTSKSGIAPENEDRILINAHMGGFRFGSAYGGQVEAVPLAGRGRVKVIAVDYKLAPEHVYPAASQDMEDVYRYALEMTSPDKIGLYGCSAGGTLTGQMIPWLLDKGLPLPGAIGVFCSGLMETFWFGGDSGTTAPFLNAAPPPASSPASPEDRQQPRDYFDGTDRNQPMVTPGLFPEVLARFPPTLVISGTRDVAMSNAVVTHTRLLSAGVEADLFIQEGLGHGHFFYFPGSAESATAYDVIWNFFDRHLSR